MKHRSVAFRLLVCFMIMSVSTAVHAEKCNWNSINDGSGNIAVVPLSTGYGIEQVVLVESKHTGLSVTAVICNLNSNAWLWVGFVKGVDYSDNGVTIVGRSCRSATGNVITVVFPSNIPGTPSPTYFAVVSYCIQRVALP